MQAVDIIRSAIATSRHNERGQTASDDELVSLIGDLLEGYGAEGARVNPAFFGKRFTVEYDEEEEGWPRPSGASVVVRLLAGDDMETDGEDEIEPGTEIVDLVIDQLEAEPGRPAVYSWGQIWHPAGRDSDPAKGELVVLASRLPKRPEKASDDLDSIWPEAHAALLVWDLAVYLATKDGERDAEVQAFAAQRQTAHERFIAFLESESTTAHRDYGHGQMFASSRVTPR